MLRIFLQPFLRNLTLNCAVPYLGYGLCGIASGETVKEAEGNENEKGIAGSVGGVAGGMGRWGAGNKFGGRHGEGRDECGG
jgi:hypothetical protein